MAAAHVAGGRVASCGRSYGCSSAPKTIEDRVDRRVTAKAHEAARSAEVAKGAGMGWLSPGGRAVEFWEAGSEEQV